MPEFVFDPQTSELHNECLDLKGNPTIKNDWWLATYSDKTKYNYTVAHWATTEARFRKHLKRISPGEAAKLVPLDDMLLCLTQGDVVNRKVFDESHRAYVPDFAVTILAENGGKMQHYSVSRQVVLFCVERRKAWRILQSKAGIANPDYQAQRALLAKVDAGDIPIDDLRSRGRELYDAEVAAL